jgi:hypothetical protein
MDDFLVGSCVMQVRRGGEGGSGKPVPDGKDAKMENWGLDVVL